MSYPIEIRRAVAADCPRLLELIIELAVFEKAPEQVTNTVESFRESGFGPHPVWWGFVAAVKSEANPEGRIDGFAMYYIRYSTWKGERMYLEDLIVTESARGNKIGSLLFERLLVEAKEKKFTGMVWQVLDWNEPAIKFYKRYNAEMSGEWLNCVIEL